jgi:hypothetical protein
MKKNIYLAGKVKSDNYDREGGWRFKLIKELFGVSIEIGLIDADVDFRNINKVSINDKLNYIGPFLYGCDHGCSHRLDYAHGMLTCCDMPDQDKPNYEVLSVSLKQVELSDIIIVNFTILPLEMYGAIAEIGYAYALNKKIFGLGNPEREIWFAQGMCDMCENTLELKEKLNLYLK